MSIRLMFLTDGYIAHGYSTAIIGIGSAGRQALYTFELPTYCEDTYSLARSVFINDDSAIVSGCAAEPPYYVEGDWPASDEKDDPLYPCKVNDWVIVLADLREEGALATIKKCVEAHAQHEHPEKKFICITYAKDECYATEKLGKICDLLILTDKNPKDLMRPVELILFDMYGGCVTLMDKSDVVCTLEKCKIMYHRYEHFDSDKEAEVKVGDLKNELQRVERGENTIHAIIASKGGIDSSGYTYAASELADYFWKNDDVAVFQYKAEWKPIKAIVSLLYGLAPFEERSMLQALNAWADELRKEHPGEGVIELSLENL